MAIYVFQFYFYVQPLDAPFNLLSSCILFQRRKQWQWNAGRVCRVRKHRNRGNSGDLYSVYYWCFRKFSFKRAVTLAKHNSFCNTGGCSFWSLNSLFTGAPCFRCLYDLFHCLNSYFKFLQHLVGQLGWEWGTLWYTYIVYTVYTPLCMFYSGMRADSQTESDLEVRRMEALERLTSAVEQNTLAQRDLLAEMQQLCAHIRQLLDTRSPSAPSCNEHLPANTPTNTHWCILPVLFFILPFTFSW